MKKILLITIIILNSILCYSQSSPVCGADQPKKYLKLLKNKRVAVVGNNTTVVGDTHLVDFLKDNKVNVVKAFAPEHGFRGDAAAGAKIADGIDEKSGVKTVSLYGKNYKPSKEQLQDVDVIIYDIQDVGCRFYTYISTMAYVMEAAAENGKKLIILDRPNPNGHYIDGNILDEKYRSFVGMHKVPIVYGMTAGEYALMVNGERWLKNGVKADLTVIPCLNYDHNTRYSLPHAPSPNLANDHAINLYPSTCFFEGTPLSEGRGTEAPFEIFGSPDLPETGFKFTPKSSKNKDVVCNGIDLRNVPDLSKINLEYVIWAYNNYPEKEKFFTKFFDTLSGTTELREQIVSGKTSEEIRDTWKKGIEDFKPIRKKYLLYKDFE